MLKGDDFLGFYADRREALLKLIEQAMGKGAFRGEAATPESDLADSDDGDEEQEDDIVEDATALVA